MQDGEGEMGRGEGVTTGCAEELKGGGTVRRKQVRERAKGRTGGKGEGERREGGKSRDEQGRRHVGL